jgi:hypothetical protein
MGVLFFGFVNLDLGYRDFDTETLEMSREGFENEFFCYP